MFWHNVKTIVVTLVFLVALMMYSYVDATDEEETLSGDEIMAKADERIEKYRKEDAVIQIVDGDGKPLSGVRVEIEQVSHEFLFGCNIFMLNKSGGSTFDKAYREQFAEIFNFATLPFYWWGYERERGKPDYAGTKKYVKWCGEHDIKMKGHPLVWNHKDPEWLPDDLDEVHRLQMQRVADCVERFKGVVDIWDVVNEPTDFERLKDKKMTGVWLKSGKIPFILEAFENAREADPGAILLINDYKTGEGYEGVVEQLVDKKGGRIYDAVGVQSHMYSGAWAPEKTWDVCERFSRFGVPIHFTEVTVLSGKLGWNQPKPWESTEEGEKYQVEHVEEFYTVLFSHPSVEAITWWDFSDRGAWMGAPAGLIRKDGTLKPSYIKLRELIKGKWWTTVSGKTDETGKLEFRGFRGRYRVKAHHADQVFTEGIEITRDGPKEFVIQVR